MWVHSLKNKEDGVVLWSHLYDINLIWRVPGHTVMCHIIYWVIHLHRSSASCFPLDRHPPESDRASTGLGWEGHWHRDLRLRTEKVWTHSKHTRCKTWHICARVILGSLMFIFIAQRWERYREAKSSAKDHTVRSEQSEASLGRSKVHVFTLKLTLLFFIKITNK